MATFAFIVASLTGHIHSTFKLARALRNHGHQVVYFGDGGRGQEFVTAQGYAYESVPFLHSISPGAVSADRGWLAPGEATRMAAALVERWSPSLLVFDPFFLVYAIAFHPTRVPVAALSTKMLLDWDPLVPPYTSALVPERGASSMARVQAEWLRSYALSAMARTATWVRSFRNGYTPYGFAQRLARDAHYPLEAEWAPRPVPFDARLRSVPELVLHAREFDFPRARPLRAGVHYLGPCVDLERAAPAVGLPEIPRGRRIVFCSLGTIRARRERVATFLRRVIAAFRGSTEHALVIATGDPEITRALACPRDHIQVHDFVPQLEVLRRASLHITHGGSSSVKESILLGVPMLVYPRGADQPGNAARVVFHGLGARGEIDSAQPRHIAETVRRLMDDRAIHDSVGRMREHFLRYDERSTAELLGRIAGV